MFKIFSKDTSKATVDCSNTLETKPILKELITNIRYSFLFAFFCFILNKLWYVIPKLSQIRPRHRCFSSFDIYIGRTRYHRLLLTCYKMNGSKNPVTLKQYFFPSIQWPQSVHFCLRKLILDVTRFIKFDIESLRLLKRHAKLSLDMTCY